MLSLRRTETPAAQHHVAQNLHGVAVVFGGRYRAAVHMALQGSSPAAGPTGMHPSDGHGSVDQHTLGPNTKIIMRLT